MLSVIGYVLLIAGVVFIVVSLVLSVIWKIPSLIDELSGRKAKRHIDRMRKLNIATGSMNVSDTAEFYRAFSEGEVQGKSVRSSYNKSDLGKLVNDPYGTVGAKYRRSDAVKKSVPVNSPVREGIPEGVTSMLDDSDISQLRGTWNIRIVKEQSSVNFEN